MLNQGKGGLPASHLDLPNLANSKTANAFIYSMVKEYLHSDMFSVTIASCYAFVTVTIGIQSTTSLA